MKIEIKDGQPVIDATYLADLLGLTPALVQTKMRGGEITSRFETGAGDDAGRMRLTCLEDGTTLKTTRIRTGGR